MKLPGAPGAANMACTRRNSNGGGKRRRKRWLLPKTCAPVRNRPSRIGAVSPNWNASCAARTVRWPRPRPCWCCQKKSPRSSTRTRARTHDRPRRSPGTGPGYRAGASCRCAAAAGLRNCRHYPAHAAALAVRRRPAPGRWPAASSTSTAGSTRAAGFADLESARQWAASFVRWYNHDHRHSGIRYVSPAQRHAGADHAILQQRHALYCQARERHPRRWSGNTRNWTPIGASTLNPERDVVVHAHVGAIDMLTLSGRSLNAALPILAALKFTPSAFPNAACLLPTAIVHLPTKASFLFHQICVQ